MMDIYTTSFTYPRVPQTSHPLDYGNPFAIQNALGDPVAMSALATDAEAIQQVALNATQTHGCLVSFTKAAHGKSWNFHLSGAYQQVIAARGMILRECPTQVHFVLHSSDPCTSFSNQCCLLFLW